MRILAHIHTYNDADVIDAMLDTVLGQIRPVDEIVVVDNASSDGTIGRVESRGIRVLRHVYNSGTSGSVATGLCYAIEHDFDWIWILDGDSQPRADALEKLLELHASFEPDERSRIGVIACTQFLPTGDLHLGRMLPPSGPRPVPVDPEKPYCDVDTTIWSGSLIRIDAARRIAPPRFGKHAWVDLGLDYGDLEYLYRLKRAGYRVLVHRSSILDHPVGTARQLSLFGRKLWTSNHSAARRYLLFRNLVFFWLYLYGPSRDWWGLSLWFGYRLGATLLGIVLLEEDAWTKVRACFQGIRDGFRKNLQDQFEVSRL